MFAKVISIPLYLQTHHPIQAIHQFHWASYFACFPPAQVKWASNGLAKPNSQPRLLSFLLRAIYWRRHVDHVDWATIVSSLPRICSHYSSLWRCHCLQWHCWFSLMSHWSSHYTIHSLYRGQQDVCWLCHSWRRCPRRCRCQSHHISRYRDRCAFLIGSCCPRWLDPEYFFSSQLAKEELV